MAKKQSRPESLSLAETFPAVDGEPDQDAASQASAAIDDAEDIPVIDPRPPKNPIEPLDDNGRRIRWYRQCPLCFHGLGGVGIAKTTRGKKRYYGCNCCGHSWVITFKFEVVKLEHRVVDLQTRDGELRELK